MAVYCRILITKNMTTVEALMILESHRRWLKDKENLPKVDESKVIEAIKVVSNYLFNN